MVNLYPVYILLENPKTKANCDYWVSRKAQATDDGRCKKKSTKTTKSTQPLSEGLLHQQSLLVGSATPPRFRLVSDK